ncbi:MAG TPA: hypothetical protein VNK82_10790 [Terriglobales bacterium]|nr:hypothetical protein [Terriglobales bacterium]
MKRKERRTSQRNARRKNRRDSDLVKGATEAERPGERLPVSFTGQLGHRGVDDLTKEFDTDFPEPGLSPEHSGQAIAGKEKKRPA